MRSQFGEPSLDGGMNVLVGLREFERATFELALDPSQPTFDGAKLPWLENPRGSKSARVGDAACDVERVEVEVDFE
jgi:hypothetical protein